MSHSLAYQSLSCPTVWLTSLSHVPQSGLPISLVYHSLAYRLDTGKKGMLLEGYGLRKTLNYIRQTYGNPDVYVTENGLSDCGTMKDEKRITYIKEYSNNVLKGKIIIYHRISNVLQGRVVNYQPIRVIRESPTLRNIATTS